MFILTLLGGALSAHAYQATSYTENFETVGSGVTNGLPTGWHIPKEWIRVKPSANQTINGQFAIGEPTDKTTKNCSGGSLHSYEAGAAYEGSAALITQVNKTQGANASVFDVDGITAAQSPLYYITRNSELSFYFYAGYKGNHANLEHVRAEYSEDGGTTWRVITDVQNVVLGAVANWKKATVSNLVAGSQIVVRIAAYTNESNSPNCANDEILEVGIDKLQIVPKDGSALTNYTQLNANNATAELGFGYVGAALQSATGGFPVKSSFVREASSKTNNEFPFVTKFAKGANSTLKQCEMRINLDWFDDSVELSKGNKVIFKLLQKHYENNAEIKALFDSNRQSTSWTNATAPVSHNGAWTPWLKDKAGRPELVLNNQGIQLFVTTYEGLRVNILPYISKGTADYIQDNKAFDCNSVTETQWMLRFINNNSSDEVKEKITASLFLYVDKDILDPNKDADGDGLTNGEEAMIGTNPRNKDTDGDGVEDLAEVVWVHNPRNTDGDSKIDALDKDDDGDGIDTKNELSDGSAANVAKDVDADGAPNYLDKDSDGDGVLDGLENTDSNADGIKDYLQAKATANPQSVAAGGDSDADGLSDKQECALVTNKKPAVCIDTDGDSIPDYMDSDSDNDGTSDKDESNNGTNPNGDVDGDGIPTHLDADETNAGATTDGSGDSDKDGLSDTLECARTNTTFPANCVDTDGDGTPDYLDTDSDNDGKTDKDESNNGANPNRDLDGDGIPSVKDADETNKGNMTDGSGDSDKDGLSDIKECARTNTSFPANCVDTDKDGTPDYMDVDSNNNGTCDGANSVPGVCVGTNVTGGGSGTGGASGASGSSGTQGAAQAAPSQQPLGKIKTGMQGIGSLSIVHLMLLLFSGVLIRKRKN